jgi:NAD(P)-dependent dehydrogenase (short-subunit alcohol dehydrogenase family)
MALEINLKDQVVLITGVSSGIGAGVAVMFAKAGASISGCARANQDSAPVNQFIQSIEYEGQQALYTETDVTDLSDLERLVKRTIDHFGRLDILISNAGVNVFEGVENCTEERWDYNLDLNLTSHWRLSKLCKPHLEKSETGCIIIMTSNHAFSSISGCFPYNVTKTALTGLVRAMAIELSPGVRTMGLAPGFIDTAGNNKWFNSFPDPAVERQRTIDLHPVKKIGTVEEVGAFCVFLSSKWAGFASGSTYLLDGGRSAIMQD